MDEGSTESSPQWSPDRQWWWDGTKWVPASDAPADAGESGGDAVPDKLVVPLLEPAAEPLASTSTRPILVKGKVRLTGITSAAKLASGPPGWKVGSVVLPVMEGSKLTFRAGFKTGDYPLSGATAALLGPDQFRISCSDSPGSSDQFVFSCSDSAGVVAEFVRNGGLIAPDSQPIAISTDEPSVAKAPSVPLNILGIELVGGSPDFKAGSKVGLSLSGDFLQVQSGFKKVQYDLAYVVAMAQTQNEIERRVTATRLLAVGVFAFAWKKQSGHHHQYLNVEYDDGARQLAMVFETDKAPNLAQKLQDASNAAKRRRGVGPKPTPGNSQPVEDVPGKIRQLAELRDAGVLTEDEFAAKKAELLARM